LKRNIAALILAAGSSSRMGEPKQMLRFGSSTLLRHIVEEALASDAASTLVVIGAEADAIRREVDQRVAIVENARWSEGIGTSISAGVEAANDFDAVVILTCDQPHVSAATINCLIAEHESGGKPMVACAYGNTLGVPALFARELFAKLRRLPADEGAKRLLFQDRECVGTIEFGEGAVDLDTAMDYARFLKAE
jgi:molybdenum cofactor cytidylyltransferase